MRCSFADTYLMVRKIRAVTASAETLRSMGRSAKYIGKLHVHAFFYTSITRIGWIKYCLKFKRLGGGARDVGDSAQASKCHVNFGPKM